MKPQLTKTVFGTECNADWEDMTPVSEKCRFCCHCQKNVVDLRDKTYKEVQAYIKAQPEACITFNLPLYELSFPSLKYAAMLVLPVWLLGQPHNSEFRAIRQTEHFLNSTSASEFKQNNPQSYSEGPGEEMFQHKATRRTRRLYLSKRFPFIHLRKKPVITGRYYNPQP